MPRRALSSAVSCLGLALLTACGSASPDAEARVDPSGSADPSASATALPTGPQAAPWTQTTRTYPTHTRPSAAARTTPSVTEDERTLVASFGKVPLGQGMSVRTMREVGHSVYFERRFNLYRAFAGGKLTDLGVGKGLTMSPDQTRYAYWGQEGFGTGTALLVVRRTSDDAEVMRKELTFQDPPQLLWAASGLYLLDSGGDAAGYQELRTGYRVDPDTQERTPIWVPEGTTVLIGDKPDVVFVTDHPSKLSIRVRRWTPGSPRDTFQAERTFPNRAMLLTPDGTKLVSEREVYDAATFAQVGSIDLPMERAETPGWLDNEYAYSRDSRGSDNAKPTLVACALTGQNDCFVDPTRDIP